MTVRLIAQVCMYNEASKGNLRRCLDNLRRYCDGIVIWDDGSTDCSVEVARHSTSAIIGGGSNDQIHELAHKQAILERAIEMGATHLFWLDCDEVLDRPGTLGGLRALCQEWPRGVDAYSFPEVNLWRGETWARRDTLFEKARFVRLWKVSPGLRFDVRPGVHLRLYPKNIHNIKEAPYRVIHYGFCDYPRMMEKIGAHRMSREELQRCAEDNWILDERQCCCYRVPEEWIPPGCKPLRDGPEPKPKAIADLVERASLWAEEPLIDQAGAQRWQAAHNNGYHGTAEAIHERNRQAWTERAVYPVERHSLFWFDPAGKTVIDIGAAGGWYMLDCLRAGARQVIGLEVDRELIDCARASFARLDIDSLCYSFIYLSADAQPVVPAVDIIFCRALFQHVPYQVARTWLRWIVAHLKPGGEAHLQYHRPSPDSRTTFFDNEQNVATAELERDMADAGLEIVNCRLATGKDVLPVWWLYTVRRANDGL